jgi:hypothetical protein
MVFCPPVFKSSIDTFKTHFERTGNLKTLDSNAADQTESGYDMHHGDADSHHLLATILDEGNRGATAAQQPLFETKPSHRQRSAPKGQRSVV